MKSFHCNSCGNVVFFENVKCVNCGHILGFLPFPVGELTALDPASDGAWRKAGQTSGEFYSQCSNGLEHQVCNWMVAGNGGRSFCNSCRMNEIIPDLSVTGNLQRWQKLEIAKRRLLYTIFRLGLPITAVPEENRPALRFKFIADVPGGHPALTGHLNGVITLNISEADDVEREQRRVSLHEPYRTVLGHLRHEVAHYFWDRLVARSQWLERFRQTFGDEAVDYQTALKQHYDQGPPADWQANYVSAYASSHPWEDWAETWAHYFHIIEIVETAEAFGIGLNPASSSPATNAGFQEVLQAWFPLTQAINSLNRCMGMPDAYPFVLADKAIEKLRFIHEVVLGNSGT